MKRALSKPCPHCGAKTGEPCVIPVPGVKGADGKPVRWPFGTHVARQQAVGLIRS